MNNFWMYFVFAIINLILCRADIREYEKIGDTFNNVNMTLLDTENDIRDGWVIGSAPSHGYLYYYQDPLKINKTILNLANPDDIDLNKFKGVEGVWVFPRKQFLTPPAETLYAIFDFLGVQLYESIGINYYAYKGGEINIFAADKMFATFKGENGSTGWSYKSVDFPSPTANFRVEVYAEDEGSFVFLDKITASWGVEVNEETGLKTAISSEKPVKTNELVGTISSVENYCRYWCYLVLLVVIILATCQTMRTRMRNRGWSRGGEQRLLENNVPVDFLPESTESKYFVQIPHKKLIQTRYITPPVGLLAEHKMSDDSSMERQLMLWPLVLRK